VIKKKFGYSCSEYLNYLDFIDNCRTIECVLKAFEDLLGCQRLLVQNARPYSRTSIKKHIYVTKNIPKEAVNFLTEKYSSNLSPVAKFVVNRGYAVWLSDLISEPHFIDMGYVKTLQAAMDAVGDGICVPSFYKHDWAYSFISFGKSKSDCEDMLLLQVETLVRRSHIRYVILKELFQQKVSLTLRELQVVELIALGKTNSEIAIILEIKPSTVAGYVKNIYLKLDAADRVTATLKAISYDLIA
jgi:DNA-binding CsgD family transcriptional regulator